MKPSELMKACGSLTGSFEPESPDHWRWMLANGEGKERAMAWVKLKSVANKSPWCVDEAGKHLRIESLAADLNWQLQTARNVCAVLVQEGRITTQRGRILYRANVPDKSDEPETTQEGDLYSVQSIFPLYLHDFIRSLSEPEVAKLAEYTRWRKAFFAAGVAELRSIDERMQDNILTQVGCKDKKHLPKRRPDAEPMVKLELVELPNFVQSMSAIAARQCTESGSAEYKPAPVLVQRSAQNGPTLVHQTKTKNKSNELSPSSSSDAKLLAELLTIDDDAAHKLLREVRKLNPKITPRVIAELALSKLLQMGKGAKNRVGLILSAVPKMARGAMLTAATKAAAKTVENEMRQAHFEQVEGPELEAKLLQLERERWEIGQLELVASGSAPDSERPGKF